VGLLGQLQSVILMWLVQVSESAQTVAERQDVDSVPLLDDVRFYIAQIHGDGDLSGELSHPR
jgi:hypothetical protein